MLLLDGEESAEVEQQGLLLLLERDRREADLVVRDRGGRGSVSETKRERERERERKKKPPSRTMMIRVQRQEGPPTDSPFRYPLSSTAVSSCPYLAQKRSPGPQSERGWPAWRALFFLMRARGATTTAGQVEAAGRKESELLLLLLSLLMGSRSRDLSKREGEAKNDEPRLRWKARKE